MWLYLILLGWYLVVVAVSLLGVYTVWSFTRKITVSQPRSTPGVSILRPLKGIDTELYQNLRSGLSQKMPFEMVFCIADPNDPAREVVNRLMAEFPEADVKLLVGNENYGPNPKINNLAKGYEAAKYDLLWVLDSNVAVSSLTLLQAVHIFESNPRIQLVHNIPTAVATHGGWGARLEEMYLLTSHSKFYAGINTVGIAPCVCGKSNFYRRSDLDRSTNSSPGHGIRTFANYISEDHLIAESLWAQGGRTKLVNQPVVQPLGTAHLQTYTQRRIRWLRVRKYMVMAATLVEPTTESLLAGIIGSFAVSGLRGTSFPWLFLLLHMCLWCAVDYFNFHNILAFQNCDSDLKASYMTRYSSPDSKLSGKRRPVWNWVPVWLARELLCLPIWATAMVGSEIIWRDKPFTIRPDLVAEELEAS